MVPIRQVSVVRLLTLALHLAAFVTGTPVPLANEALTATKVAEPRALSSTFGKLRKPRTWTKPYSGKPSAKCYRNPGISALQPAKESHEEIDGSATNKGDAMPDTHALHAVNGASHQAKASSLVARQPHDDQEISASAVAAYHFTCPQGGAMSQIFMWGVVYLEHDQHVQMINWHNILAFSNTRFIRRTGRWLSSWESEWCVPHDKLECWYKAFGHTYGDLNLLSRSITIGLVNLNPERIQVPEVFEYCDEIGRGPNLNRGVSCLIQEVQAFTEH